MNAHWRATEKKKIILNKIKNNSSFYWCGKCDIKKKLSKKLQFYGSSTKPHSRSKHNFILIRFLFSFWIFIQNDSMFCEFVPIVSCSVFILVVHVFFSVSINVFAILVCVIISYWVWTGRIHFCVYIQNIYQIFLPLHISIYWVNHIKAKTNVCIECMEKTYTANRDRPKKKERANKRACKRDSSCVSVFFVVVILKPYTSCGCFDILKPSNNTSLTRTHVFF